ncbi:uncharacterized protein GGS25DRAFT_494025 [Hypoxylon fragiforme]|uniref:uncharacterized protein n=1 Tax=Hypoxylon fragiforme TaxID=63214 RepID=UPI0020C7110D|nr:uncharacterized protein GGS25DRAFT_494025 [Hypoxylon fragiforme]KAI2606997.1 hypothetical protein GGS25DRAFT_494025 [Hypoxylon fragiforme]
MPPLFLTLFLLAQAFTLGESKPSNDHPAAASLTTLSSPTANAALSKSWSVNWTASMQAHMPLDKPIPIITKGPLETSPTRRNSSTGAAPTLATCANITSVKTIISATTVTVWSVPKLAATAASSSCPPCSEYEGPPILPSSVAHNHTIQTSVMSTTAKSLTRTTPGLVPIGIIGPTILSEPVTIPNDRVPPYPNPPPLSSPESSPSSPLPSSTTTIAGLSAAEYSPKSTSTTPSMATMTTTTTTSSTDSGSGSAATPTTTFTTTMDLQVLPVNSGGTTIRPTLDFEE